MVASNTRKIKAILTFDDGLISHYTLLKPLLEKYKFSATVFVTIPELWTRPEITNVDPSAKETNLSPSQYMALHESGLVEIGNHTFNHILLPGTPAEVIIEEVERLEALLHNCGLPRCTSFSYPTFRSDAKSADILRALGFTFARSGYTRSPIKEWHLIPELRESVSYYIPGKTDPLEVFCTGVFNERYTLEHLEKDLQNCPENGFPVFAAHGIIKPQSYQSLVNIFAYMAEEGHEFIACRDAK